MPTCATCNKEIEGPVLNAMEKDFHPDCFRCSKCDQSFTDGTAPDGESGSVHQFEGQILCGKCEDTRKSESAAQKDAEAPVCAKCSQKITGSLLSFNDETLHEECFNCDKCGNTLKGGKVFLHEKERWCEGCHTTGEAAAQETCANCNEKIPVEHVLDALGKKWHPACFKCITCDKPIGMEKGQITFTEVKDGVSCQACIKGDQAASAAPAVAAEPEVPAAAPAAAPVAAPAAAPAPAAPTPAANAGDRAHFALEALQDTEACRANGVNPKERELHLTDSDFQTTFGMDKAAFQALAKFKQDKLKKDHKLF